MKTPITPKKPNLSLKVPEELKMWLKLHCAKNEIGMTELIIDLLNKYKSNQS